jgi:Fe-Mn family superoxide dismutase
MELKKVTNKIKEIETLIKEGKTINENSEKQIITEMKKINVEKLPYSYSALSRFIDAETMDTHYNKHYKGYVSKLNEALKSREEQDLELEQIIKGISRFNTTIRNNGGGAYNHALFWKMLSPRQQKCEGAIYDEIIKTFQSFSNFKKLFEKEASKRFGSGWVWLVLTNNNKIKIMSTPNQDNPLMNVVKNGGYPLLGLDLWEHAYYLKYRNKKDDYIKNFWSVINWKFINDTYIKKIEKKVNEGKLIKKVISEGINTSCNKTQILNYRDIFNKNPIVKKKYMNTIMIILKEVFSEYWFEKEQYSKEQMSGIYDYEQNGRSIINKLNTNYTTFCMIINNVNLYLKKYGINPINFINLSKEEEILEVERLNKYLIELRYKIFNSESPTFKNLINTLDNVNKHGEKTEIDTISSLKKIFDTNKVFKVSDLGNKRDMLEGVDAYIELPEGNKTIQIKPFNHVIKKNGKNIIIGSANVKKYKTDFLVFYNPKIGTLVFENQNTKIVDGKYIFDDIYLFKEDKN